MGNGVTIGAGKLHTIWVFNPHRLGEVNGFAIYVYSLVLPSKRPSIDKKENCEGLDLKLTVSYWAGLDVIERNSMLTLLDMCTYFE